MKIKAVAAVPVVIAALVGWKLVAEDSGVRPELPRLDIAARGEPLRDHGGVLQPERLAVDDAVPHTDEQESVGEGSDPQEVSTVLGFVNDVEGQPIPGALVRFVPLEGEIRHARTTSARGFSVAGLPRGTWTVIGSAPGYQETELRRALLAESERIDLTLPAATALPVRFLTADGESLIDALEDKDCKADFLHTDSLFAVATLEPPPATIDAVCSNDRYGRGVYTRDYVDDDDGVDGSLLCDAPLPVYVSAVLRDVVLDTQLVPAGASEVTFTIPVERIADLSTTICFEVVDSQTQQRIDWASIGLSNSKSTKSGFKEQPDDTYRLEGQPFGRVGLWIRARGYTPFFRFIDLDPGAEHDLGTIHLHATPMVHGRVVTTAAEPVDTWIHEYDLDALQPDHPMPMNLVFRDTDEYGAFEVEAWTQRALIVARPKKPGLGLATAVVEGGVESPLPVELVLHPSVRVTLSPRFTRAVVLRVLDAQGLPLWSRLVSAERHELQLSPGTYTVEIVAEGEVVRVLPLEVGDAPMLFDVVG